MSNSDSYQDTGDKEVFECIITEEDVANYKRLDQYLSQKIRQLSRSFIKQLFQNNHITSKIESTKKLELKRMPAAGTIVQVKIPAPLPDKAQAENIPLEIL